MIKIITFVQFTFKRHSPVSVHQLIGKQVAPKVINFQLKSNSTTAQINIFSVKEAMVLKIKDRPKRSIWRRNDRMLLC